MVDDKVKKLTLGGLMIALVFVTTFSIKIPVPFTQGYIHGGDSMIFVAAILLGWKYGAITGGVGSALADILGGYANWALPTLIIKAIMGALVGWIAQDLRKKEKTRPSYFVTITMAIIWFGSTFILRNIIGKFITAKSTDLIGQIEGANTINELLLLSEKVQTQLLWSAILIPLIIIALAIYLYKIDKKLFAVEQLLGMLVAGLWMVSGYYVAAVIMYGSYIVPIFSIPWNIIQFVLGLIIAYFVLITLKKTPIMDYLQ